MLSDCEKHSIVFNGEIYNYQLLKKHLANFQCNFKGKSDTEILLACLKYLGVDKTLTLIDGMFVFAYWNQATQQLVIARDRMGEKPLYFRHKNSELIFASELKALTAGTIDNLTINEEAVRGFLQFSYIPGVMSIYEGVSKLLPAHTLTFDLSSPEKAPKIAPYYTFTEVDKSVQAKDHNQDTLDELLKESIALRLAADVPVGAFLSGGIDSSLICAITKKALDKNIAAHTIGFHEPEFDESKYAKEVADYLGCEHHIHMLTQQEMLNIVPKMAETYSEPFADASQLPTYLLCQKTKEEVTVALSGDAGDELFGGYSRYHIALARWQKIAKQPASIRTTLRKVSDSTLPWLDHTNMLIGGKEKFRRALRYWSSNDLGSFYEDSVSYDWSLGGAGSKLPAKKLDVLNDIRYLMQVDALQYLPDCILTKVDRASMAHSLEVRVPLLSNDILNYSRQLSSDALVSKGKGKWPLRQLLYKYIPEKIIERPKRGFAVPLKHWLRDQLQPWGESLISDRRLSDEIPFVDHAKYLLYWQQHQTRQYDWSGQLWNYLQLLNWLKTVYKA